MPSRSAVALAISWRFPQPLRRLLAATAPVVALITVVTTLPLHKLLPVHGPELLVPELLDPELLRESIHLVRRSLLTAVACSLFALAGVMVLGPTLAYLRRRVGTGPARVLRLATAALTGALLTTYSVVGTVAVTGPYAAGWPLPLPDLGIGAPGIRSEQVAGVAATVVGIAASRSLSAGQVAAYVAGCVAGLLWGLRAVELTFIEPSWTALWWTMWGFSAALAVTVARQIRRSLAGRPSRATDSLAVRRQPDRR